MEAALGLCVVVAVTGMRQLPDSSMRHAAGSTRYIASYALLARSLLRQN
jgi:hypothetical protein